MEKITAPFRWAGSKAKLTSELFDIFKESEIYVEPFLGSGVVLFQYLGGITSNNGIGRNVFGDHAPCCNN